MPELPASRGIVASRPAADRHDVKVNPDSDFISPRGGVAAFNRALTATELKRLAALRTVIACPAE